MSALSHLRSPIVRRLAALGVVSLGISLATRPTLAQTPSTGSADGAARSRADSLAELRALDAFVRAHPRDALAWHRKGVLAWRLAGDHRGSTLMSTEMVALTRGADTSLRLAVQQAPDSVRWALDLAQYLLTSHLPTSRSASWIVARQATVAARRMGDTKLLAEAADAAGMGAWRDYETYSRPQIAGADSTVITSYMLYQARIDPVARARVAKLATGDDASRFAGELDYRRAEQYFRDALAANPASREARRHLYMTLAERERWGELRDLARDRVEQQPNDAVSWLTLGLAERRSGDDEHAAAAFERGFALLPPAERARLTSITRVLPPKHVPGDTSDVLDSVAYAGATPAAQSVLARRFWRDNDPLTLTSVNEHRNEFYARVIYSELMWSVDESFVRGSETDRADALVRYGPPSLVYRQGVDTMYWRYPYRTFRFTVPRGFGLAYEMPADTAGADWQRTATPYTWQDVPASLPDSVHTVVARFRAGPDSSGIYVAAAVRVGHLADGVGRGSASVDLGFRLDDDSARVVLRDSVRTRVSADDSAATDVRAWQAAIPAGRYDYRVEALGVASRRSARARAPLRIASGATGFGASDVLVAASVAPGVRAMRWTDFAIVPNAGDVPRGAPVALLWETYALAAGADATSRYRVTVEVHPRNRPGAVTAFVGRVLGGAAGVVGLGGQASSDGTLRLSFDRQTPARAVAVDYLTLDLGAAPAGEYAVKITVADAVSGRSTATLGAFRVLEAPVR